MEYFTDPAEYFKLLCDPLNSVLAVRAVSEDMMAVSYERVEEGVERLGNVNIILAAFVTCWARLRLYGFISQLQDAQIIYFDTGW